MVAIAREASAWGRGRRSVETAARRLGWPDVAPGLLSFAVLASVGLADGGLFPRTWRLGAFALFAVAAAALLARERVAVRRLEWCALAALGAYAGWIALSSVWGGNASNGERALFYFAAVFATLVLAERTSVVKLLAGALAGITAVCAYGLATYLFTSPPLDPFEGALLHQPFGYANAVGIFAAIGVLLAAGLAVAARRLPARGAALAPLAVLVPTLLLTSSRGAWIALVPAFVALALLHDARVRRSVVAAVALLAAGAATAVVVTTGEIVGLVTENRLHYWEAALADYADHPLLGSGAGTFGDYWLAHGYGPGFTRTAHSLYLQSLAELGPVGLALALAVVAVPLVALRFRRDPVVAAAAAGYVEFVVHAGVDWDWEMPAVTLAGLFCGAAVLVASRSDAVHPLSRPVRSALVVAALALTAFAALLARTEGSLPFR